MLLLTGSRGAFGPNHRSEERKSIMLSLVLENLLVKLMPIKGLRRSQRSIR